MIEIPTFPARPVNGGRLELAPVKRGVWMSEPKWNGWRSVVHVPTCRMWNRHGNPLSITKEFTKALGRLGECRVEWLDTEALERRHDIGRGTLIVLDAIIRGVPYEERKEMVAKCFPAAPLNPEEIERDSVYVSPYVADGAELYERIRCHRGFFEGIVSKRSQSLYPFQLRSDSKETIDWMKHRYDS